MNTTLQIIGTSLVQALQEMRANKLRTFLSLLGITIGIFCIVAVKTVLDSMQDNIRKEVATLGNDVLYIGRKPWTAEDGEYKWWEYLQRPPLQYADLRKIESSVPGIRVAALLYGMGGLKVKSGGADLDGVTSYAVTTGFDKIQNIEVGQGRYLSSSELDGGVNVAVIGYEVGQNLFNPGIDPLQQTIGLMGKQFKIIGVLKKSGQNMAGFDFDNSVIYPYFIVSSMVDLNSLDWSNDPMLMIKADNEKILPEVKDEVEGALRRIRKIKPGDKNNFSINQLNQISKQLDTLFSGINAIGALIGIFALIVGAFGIANIMFVTVKERTKFIGLKKAIGARSVVILTEFLTEAIVLCLIGGLIGIFIVYLLSLLMTYGVDFAVTLSAWNIFLGVGISTLVGVVAGIIPAFRASRLDPVVAIRTT